MSNQSSVHEIGIIKLLKNTKTLFIKNLAKIFLLLAICFAVAFISFALNLTIIETLDGDAAKGLVVVLSIMTFYIYYVLNFIIVKSIDSGQGLIRSTVTILKKTIPLFLTYILITVCVSLVFAMPFIAFKTLQAPEIEFTTKVITCLFAIITAIFCIFFTIRLWFVNYVLILEEKYYLKSIKLSFKYSKKHVISLLLKNIVIILGAVVASFIILLPFILIAFLLTDSSLFDQDIFKKETLNSIVTYIPQQFVFIANYLLYKFYRAKH
ncbi:MAG: hypothetical protein EXR06_02395 [Rickettsiales bacterium]|nr:hypothetical protein [Rickettsiales bacterium]